MANELLAPVRLDTADDGTAKLSFWLSDGAQVEACSLYLPYRSPHRVLCVSSQAGCPFKCSFCASGWRDFGRNLSPDEIVQQVQVALERTTAPNEPFDVTFMGVGEPLANFPFVSEAVQRLHSAYPSLHRCNLSTIGPRGGIRAFADSPVMREHRVHLQLSLHAPFDNQRRSILRVRLPDIKETLDELHRWAGASGEQPCVNYVLFDGINDSLSHAAQLVSLVKDRPFYVKLSSYNRIPESDLRPSPAERRTAFLHALREASIEVKTFDSFGVGIRAGCGQLIADIAR